MKEQFTFIHDAILESVTCGDTQIAATNLRPVIAKLKKKDIHTQIDGFQSQFTVSTMQVDDLVPISRYYCCRLWSRCLPVWMSCSAIVLSIILTGIGEINFFLVSLQYP